jgi:hypothetical protein
MINNSSFPHLSTWVPVISAETSRGCPATSHEHLSPRGLHGGGRKLLRRKCMW